MRFKLFAGLLALALLTPFVAPLSAQDSTQQPQQDDQDIIDDFVTTRGAAFGERPKKPANANTSGNTQPKKAVKSRAEVADGNKKAGGLSGFKKTTPPREKVATNTANKNTAGPGGTNAVANANANVNTNAGAPDAGKQADGAPAVEASAEAPGGPIGLGYTILSVAGDGSNTVVDSARVFTAGDRIRIALETNADGFLYIFDAEDDGPVPVMLYPNAALDGGANKIAAHARDFFPTDLRYSFEFDNAVAIEHLYIIFARRPLADVPVGEALVALCGTADRADCEWRPAPELWSRIKAAAAAGRVVESHNNDLAKAQAPVPTASLSRGIKVKKNEPAPSVVRMNASAETDVLLTKIKLVHK